jgi:tripeptide aminopeptidase
MGLEVEEDDAAARSGAECGNLVARIPGRGERSVMLCAHLDTVALAAPVEPVVVDEGWENARDGILGADNKAAVAVFLEAARRCAVEGSPVGVELVFTVSEENALAGAKAFDVSRLRSAFGYVYDHATAIGEIVIASPTYYRLAAEFHGAAAHAGLRPEAGRSAILAAARAVAAMPLGRVDDDTTANVSFVEGGTPGTTNVVPDRARITGEARSLDRGRGVVQDAAGASECDVDTMVEQLFEGYRTRPGAPAVAAAEAALQTCGYEPRHIRTGSASDANAFAAAGFECVNLANGTERNHEPTERVSVAALESMLDVTFALLDSVAEAPGG